MRIRFFALAALALLLGACTQDEAGFLPEGAEGTPIVFTATGLNPAATAIAGTRAPADGNWTGVQSVAVMMDGTVKTYGVVALHRWRDNPACGKGKSQPKCPEGL